MEGKLYSLCPRPRRGRDPSTPLLSLFRGKIFCLSRSRCSCVQNFSRTAFMSGQALNPSSHEGMPDLVMGRVVIVSVRGYGCPTPKRGLLSIPVGSDFRYPRSKELWLLRNTGPPASRRVGFFLGVVRPPASLMSFFFLSRPFLLFQERLFGCHRLLLARRRCSFSWSPPV